MMNLQKISILLIVLTALFVAGCKASPTATPTLAPTVVPTNTPIPTNTPVPPTDTPAPPTVTPTETLLPPVATTKLIVSVRAGPSVSYPVLGKLNKGERRPILGKSEDSKWWQVDLNGKLGWIPADYTDVQGGTSVVAVVSVDPLPNFTPTATLGLGSRVTPTATPTVAVSKPSGRIYFVVQDHAAWLAPTAKDKIYSDVTLGTPSDLSNTGISTNAAPLDWSEAAGKLVYVLGGGQDKLQIIDQDKNIATLASHGAIVTPRWFSDGVLVAFIGYDNNLQNQKIYVIDARNGNVVQSCPARSGEQLRGLAVNRKNGDIAFVSNYGGRFEIWKTDRYCNTPVQLTKDNADITAPAFSPDGTKLAYVSNKTLPTDYQIYVMSAQGGNATRLGPGFAPAFSSDGFWIAFARNLEVYIMDLTGNSIQPLAPGDRPVWVP